MKGTYDLLQRHYPPGQYALLEEVSDAAGFSRSGSLDFMAMSLWPSRGLDLIGIEVKSYRGDWLKELKNPAKQEGHFQHCDRFYLLTITESVAKLEEIPPTWGWLQVEKSRIVVKKEAPKLIPKEISRSFLAALLKRASDKKGI